MIQIRRVVSIKYGPYSSYGQGEISVDHGFSDFHIVIRITYGTQIVWTTVQQQISVVVFFTNFSRKKTKVFS